MKKKMKTYRPRPNWNGWTKWLVVHSEEVISCCDCGLAHTFLFKSDKGKVWMRIKRNKEVTKENRSSHQTARGEKS